MDNLMLFDIIGLALLVAWSIYWSIQSYLGLANSLTHSFQAEDERVWERDIEERNTQWTLL